MPDRQSEKRIRLEEPRLLHRLSGARTLPPCRVDTRRRPRLCCRELRLGKHLRPPSTRRRSRRVVRKDCLAFVVGPNRNRRSAIDDRAPRSSRRGADGGVLRGHWRWISLVVLMAIPASPSALGATQTRGSMLNRGTNGKPRGNREPRSRNGEPTFRLGFPVPRPRDHGGVVDRSVLVERGRLPRCVLPRVSQRRAAPLPTTQS